MFLDLLLAALAIAGRSWAGLNHSSCPFNLLIIIEILMYCHKFTSCDGCDVRDMDTVDRNCSLQKEQIM